MKLWLWRHAQVLAAPGLCYGVSDLAADETWTVRAASRLAPMLPAGTLLRVSDLLRARQLEQAMHRMRSDLKGRIDLRLREMDFGCWELQPWDTIPRRAFDPWMADFSGYRFGGAESVQELLERVAGALQQTLESTGPHGQALWITHAGVIRAVEHMLQHGSRSPASAADWPRHAPDPGDWVTFEV